MLKAIRQIKKETKMPKTAKTTKKTAKNTTKTAVTKKTTKTVRVAKPAAVKPVVQPIEDLPTWVKLVAIILIILGYTVYRFWGIAKVNNITISRLSYYQAMERQIGKQTLDNMITETLIAQAGANQNVQIDQKAIDDEIATISAQIVAQGQTVEQALEAENITMAEVRRQFELQQIVQILGRGDTTVTDTEIDEYITENKDNLPTTLSTTEVRDMVKKQLESQKANQNISAWIEQLKSSAQIVQY